MFIDKRIRLPHIEDIEQERPMSSFHRDYHEARKAAAQLANELKKEVGLEKFSEYGKPGFRVFSLPKLENRRSFELRCETVTPTVLPIA
jgi:hypothetical protein